ncbi:MAG: hypothetical protein J5716_02520 [Alphaproteobacteria bacterium]|nr:hypothetical protein [Alphaproteobacteria bacterium]
MPYTVTASERNNESASNQETKALLYLMNFRQDSDDIFYFVIDFFNDVTGVDRAGSCGWDVQAKAHKNLSQSLVGKYLVTLYKNYLSDFNFNSYILFVGGISSSILCNVSLREFGIDNFKNEAKNKIAESLKKEAKQKTYIDDNLVTDENINDFLLKVVFVIADEEKANYIKNFITINPDILPPDTYLNRIFDQIRDIQTSKKNINTENITINALCEFVKYKKHITNYEIKMLVLSRLIHKNGINNTPTCFWPILEGMGDLEKNEIIEECQDCMARIICDTNNRVAYWDLFEDIYKQVARHPEDTVDYIYGLVNADKINKVQFLNIMSTKFFIALVKDGLRYA